MARVLLLLPLALVAAVAADADEFCARIYGAADQFGLSEEEQKAVYKRCFEVSAAHQTRLFKGSDELRACTTFIHLMQQLDINIGYSPSDCLRSHGPIRAFKHSLFDVDTTMSREAFCSLVVDAVKENEADPYHHAYVFDKCVSLPRGPARVFKQDPNDGWYSIYDGFCTKLMKMNKDQEHNGVRSHEECMLIADKLAHMKSDAKSACSLRHKLMEGGHIQGESYETCLSMWNETLGRQSNAIDACRRTMHVFINYQPDADDAAKAEAWMVCMKSQGFTPVRHGAVYTEEFE